MSLGVLDMTSHSHNALLIDVHTHVVPESFPAYVGVHRDAPWPSMVDAAQACHRHVVVSGSNYRTVSHQCWDCVVRQREMEQQHVHQQVLSPMPELLSYWLSPEDGRVMCTYLNEVIAEMVQRAPGSFIGLGAVPLQDVDMAIEVLEYAVRGLGLSGVEIGGNINGVVIGDAHFLPFFQAATRLGAAVFVHPLRPSGLDRLVGPPALEQVLAFPGETGLAAASMITGGTLARLPELRIAYSHGGGSLAMLLPRLQYAWTALQQVRDHLPIEPVLAARSMFYDNLVYDDNTIRHLIQVFGSDQVMVGTDYPFSIMDADPFDRLGRLNLPSDVIRNLQSNNARRWLGIGEAA